MTDPGTVTPEEARARLAALGDHVRDLVVGARGTDLAAVAGRNRADVHYAVDRLADDGLVSWFEAHWPGVEVVSEGLDQSVVVGTDPQWTVVVDTVDGTRGLMHDKRSAWSLGAAAPHGGTLADVVVAVMTELPTTKAAVGDQLGAVRGVGVRAERIALEGGTRRPLAIRPSGATDLEHGFAGLAKFFPEGKATLGALEAELFDRLGAREVFDDQYLCSGGQLHELATGRDRFVADLRPLVTPAAMAAHPYDVCTALVLEEAGGVVTDPWGGRLDAPLDTTTGVAWVGYANPALAAWISPVLAELLADRGYPPPSTTPG